MNILPAAGIYVFIAVIGNFHKFDTRSRTKTTKTGMGLNEAVTDIMNAYAEPASQFAYEYCGPRAESVNRLSPVLSVLPEFCQSMSGVW